MSKDDSLTKQSFSSRLDGFRNLEPEERLAKVSEIAGLSEADQEALSGKDALPIELANGMIENVVGKFELPLGIAANFTVNGIDYLVPMAVEEPSVVAASSRGCSRCNGCEYCEHNGGNARAQN